jgi:hypothetical protein
VVSVAERGGTAAAGLTEPVSTPVSTIGSFARCRIRIGDCSPWCSPAWRATVAAVEWWSIEVLNGRSSAARWKDANGTLLIEAALTNGAVDWAWHEHRWGVVLEVAFPDEWRWELFYALPAVQAALDAVPDPLSGLAVHRGRSGTSGTRLPRRPRPLAGAGAVELPEPDPDPIEEDAVEPSWIEPGFYDERPAPMPDPSPSDEPAANSTRPAVR